MRQLQRPPQHVLKLGRNQHPHRHRPGRHDRRTDLLAQQLAPRPGTGARHDTRLILIAPVRRCAPPRALIQVPERHHVVISRVQLDHMVSQRVARLLIGKQPPPLPLAGDVNRTQD